MRKFWFTFWYFLFDRLYALDALRHWKSRYEQDPLPHIGPTTPAYPERNTGEISERAIAEAMRTHGMAMRATPSPKISDGELQKLLLRNLPPGEYTRWYRDNHCREGTAIGDETQRFRATTQQMRALKQLREPRS